MQTMSRTYAGRLRSLPKLEGLAEREKDHSCMLSLSLDAEVFGEV